MLLIFPLMVLVFVIFFPVQSIVGLLFDQSRLESEFRILSSEVKVGKAKQRPQLNPDSDHPRPGSRLSTDNSSFPPPTSA